MIGLSADGIDYQYNDLEYTLEDVTREYKFAKLLAKNKSLLLRLSKFVSIPCHTISGTWYLEYHKQYKQEDAISDLAGIQRELKCIFGDLTVPDTTNSRPRAYYMADGFIGDTPVKIRLEVPWLPDGCRVNVESRRTWSTSSRYSTSCTRR